MVGFPKRAVGAARTIARGLEHPRGREMSMSSSISQLCDSAQIRSRPAICFFFGVARITGGRDWREGGAGRGRMLTTGTGRWTLAVGARGDPFADEGLAECARVPALWHDSRPRLLDQGTSCAIARGVELTTVAGAMKGRSSTLYERRPHAGPRRGKSRPESLAKRGRCPNGSEGWGRDAEFDCDP